MGRVSHAKQPIRGRLVSAQRWLIAATAACMLLPSYLPASESEQGAPPVTDIAGALDVAEMTCKRPFALTQDCDMGWTSPMRLGRELHFPGVSVDVAAVANGRRVLFLHSGKRPRGMSSEQTADLAHLAVARALAAAGLSIHESIEVLFIGTRWGFVIDADGDAYTALKRASAEADVPFSRAALEAPPALPAYEWPVGREALSVDPLAGTVEEARDESAIAHLSCHGVLEFAQSCDDRAGPALEVAIGPVIARVAATADGTRLLVAAPERAPSSSPPRLSDAVHLSTRAVLVALRARGLTVKRVRAAVASSRGPVYAYLVELDGDGYSLLKSRPARPANAQ